MDPVTVAGLVLGVIPLLISAAENYEVTFQPFVTYCRHVKEVQRFTAKLDAQRAIFHNECQLLLWEVGQNLTDILGDPYHPSRNDEALSACVQELLGSSYTTCVSTLNLINDTLKEVTTETKGLQGLLDSKKSKGKAPMALFRQKIKISFSKTRLEDIIRELRQYNSDFGRLSSQVRRIGANALQQSSNVVNSAILAHLKVTQQASARLYDTLASKWICDEHVEHIASMDLKVEDRCQLSYSKVRFSLGIACSQPPVQSAPLWLAFESAPNTSLEDTPIVEQSTRLEATLENMGASRRNVRFNFSDSLVSTSLDNSVRIPRTLQDPQLNLCTIEKLCGYFRRMGVRTSRERCLGYLEKAATFKHFVFPSSNSMNSSGGSRSLKQVLYTTFERKKQEDWVEKLKLARLLSLAVLRFYSTPWLSETWSSDDICFFNNDEMAERNCLIASPYINAKLSVTDPNKQFISTNDPSLAVNKELFSLAIVLIELGYDAPFEIVSETEGHQGGTNIQADNFLAARRLSESVHRKLNMTYGRVVEKCLNCNFGVATKLKEAELQSAVVAHVVHQLEICLEQYRKFNSLAPVPI